MRGRKMTIIGQELKKWRDSLNIGELDKYDITVANIIINNFDELREAGGTARGKRSVKFAEMINKKKIYVILHYRMFLKVNHIQKSASKE